MPCIQMPTLNSPGPYLGLGLALKSVLGCVSKGLGCRLQGVTCRELAVVATYKFG